eukprot:gene10397-biopygen18293
MAATASSGPQPAFSDPQWQVPTCLSTLTPFTFATRRLLRRENRTGPTSHGPIDSLGVWFPMQSSRLGSGLEAFSHNPSSGSITALSDRTTVDTRDSTWEFLSYYPILLSDCTGPMGSLSISR